MASINSITNSGSSVFSGKGIGGLATGLNTDELVAALTSGTQSKITKQSQQKQLLNWKMTAYRSMSTSLTAFQSKYLKLGASSSNTNIMSSNFFNTYKSTSSSDKVSVSANSAAITGDYTINKVSQLAEAERFTSIIKLSDSLGFDVDSLDVSDNMFTGQTLKLDIDGFSTKTIKLDSLNSAIKDGQIDTESLKDELQKIINEAYKSKSIVDVSINDGKIIIDSKSAKISVAEDNKILGLLQGDTNRTNTNKTIGDIFDKIAGDSFLFSINGIEISANKNDTMSSFMSKINNSGANVTLSYDKYNDEFVLTSKLTGADSSIEIKDVHGNLMNQIFGVKGGNGLETGYLTNGTSITSEDLNKINNMTNAERKSLSSSLKNMDFEMTINGVTKNVKLDTVLAIDSKKLNDGTYTSEEVIDAINRGIKNAFSGTSVEFSINEDGNTVISTSNNEAFSIKTNGKFAEIMGLGDGNSVGNSFKNFGSDITLGELKNVNSGTLAFNINENESISIDYNKDTTLDELIVKINEKFGKAEIKDGKLYIESNNDNINISDSGDFLKNVFGINNGKYETQSANSNIKHTEGKNAIFELDGKTMEWSSNNISFNGINLTLNDVSDEAIKINVKADTDDVIKRIKDWMDDYNALVFTLNSAINEGKNNNYSPLTDEQKAQMTDDQIKTWETEAKKGLLRNDQTLRQILADMRNTFYEKVDSAGIYLYDIGIVTKSGMSNTNEAGQLEFDKNVSGGGEERLRQMLINNPDKVRLLFTDSSNGIGTKLNSIINNAANTSSVNRGTLVRIAGTEHLTGDNTSQLGDKIKNIDKYVNTLKSRLEAEYARYWKKFSSLETSVQKMNSQSSWLSSQ